MQPTLTKDIAEPIAIIGIGCRSPGSASSPSKLWEILQSAPELAKTIPSERFNIDRFYHPLGTHHGTTNVKESYFLEEDIKRFDTSFFNVSPLGSLSPYLILKIQLQKRLTIHDYVQMGVP